MIQVTAQTRVLVAIEPADFRRGIDGLARLCRDGLCSKPMSGSVFVFRSRRKAAVKILAYDGQGSWLCQKRLSQCRFRFWPTRSNQTVTALQAHELQVLLHGGDPDEAYAAPDWLPLAMHG